MLLNLYRNLIPRLIGENPKPLEIWHGSNRDTKEYIDGAPPEIFELWDENALAWAKEVYISPEFEQICVRFVLPPEGRTRYTLIQRQLNDEQPGPKRTQLVMEAFEMRRPDFTTVDEKTQ